MLMQMHDHKIKGFTLIELMVTVAIVGVLAAIALPSYKNSIRKSNRQVVISNMMLMKQAEEKYRNNNLAYTTSLTGVYAIDTSSSDTHYTITIPTATATGYTIQATAIGDQNGGFELTYCHTITINESDSRLPATCWAK